MHSCLPHLLKGGRASEGRPSNRKLSDSCDFSPEPDKMSELGRCTLRWVIKVTQQLGWAAGEQGELGEQGWGKPLL